MSLRASKGQDEVGRKFFRRGGQTETFPEDGCWQLIGNIFFKYQECLRRMEDVGKRGRSSRIPEVGYRVIPCEKSEKKLTKFFLDF